MKTFNYILYILGGIFVAYIFYSFITSLGMYSYNLGRPLTQSDLNYYYFVKSLAVLAGFIVGIFSFRHLLKD